MRAYLSGAERRLVGTPTKVRPQQLDARRRLVPDTARPVSCCFMYSKAASVAARVAAAGLVVAGWAGSAGVAYADPAPAPSPGPSPAASPGPAPAPAPAAASPAPAPAPGAKTTIDHDGTFAVGTDIVPGTYTTAGPKSNGTCYWKRLGNPDGALIDNAMSKKPQVVSIQATDKAFKTDGCQPWQLNMGAKPPADTPPPGAQATLGILNGLLGGQNRPQAPQAPTQTSQAPQAPQPDGH